MRGEEGKRAVFHPYPYQEACIRRIVEEPAVGLFLDMGLGKTVITLTAIHELAYSRLEPVKALVIAPKKVAEATWTDEASRWAHLEGLRVSCCVGTLKEREAALAAPADVYVINRECVVWLVQKYGRAWPFGMVVLDEASSFKNHQAKRFKALKAIRWRISRMVALTGTPAPNGYLDLWAQLYLLDGGERLGARITSYRDRYFVPDKRSSLMVYSYRLREGAREEIEARIRDICVSMSSEDYLSLPDLVVHDVPVALDAQSRAAYERMEREMILEAESEEGETVTASSAAALTAKLSQLCNGAVYDDGGGVLEVHGCKLDALEELLESLQGEHCIIYYHFRHDRDRILRRLEARGGATFAVYEGPGELAAWNAGKLDVLLAQPASCGYGLNLQHGGRHVVWFGLTWNLEEYQQANKRLHRQGQEKPVIIHRLVTQGSMDVRTARALDSKAAGQDALLDALKARIGEIKMSK